MEISACGKSKKYYCTLNWKAAILVKFSLSKSLIIPFVKILHHQTFAPYSTFKTYIQSVNTICDWAYKNQPCERKLHEVIFLAICLALNVVSHLRKFQKKAH